MSSAAAAPSPPSSSSDSEVKSPVALVTGASGFIAGWIVNYLLKRGYEVRGTVRNLQDAHKVQHLKDLFPQIRLFEADLLVPGSFARAMEGCHYVFHTASPFQLQVKDPQKELVEPAVHGTENVINEALKSATVKKIIVTSSIAAIRRSDKPDDYAFTEVDWNETSTIESEPYPFSKVQAEKRAWELFNAHSQQSHKVDMAVICPGFVLGQILSTRTDSTSVRIVSGLLNGQYEAEGADPSRHPAVDIKDVALAHILAAENEKAHGRYLVSSNCTYSRLQLADLLRKSFPKYPLPTKTRNPENFNRDLSTDASRVVKELGLAYTPMEQSLKEMGESLIALGLVKKIE